MSVGDSLLARARAVLRGAHAGEQVEVYASQHRSTNVRAYAGDVEAFTEATGAGIGVRVVFEGRQGFASAGSLDPDVVAALLDEARDNARHGEPDDANGLADPDGVAAVQLDLWRDDVAERSPDWKIAQAVALEARVRNADPRITGVRSATYGDSTSERVIVSTTGIETTERATFASLGVSALARDGRATTTGAGSTFGRSTHDLDAELAASDAVRRTTELLGARKPDTTRLSIVLEPRLAATLIELLGGMLSAAAVLKGRSLFAGRAGESIASPLVHLVEDPTDARSFGSGTHDGEGLACRAVPLIRDGVLGAYLHNTYTARRLGTASTASAVRGARSTPGVGASALALAPGRGTARDFVASLDLGLYVTSLSGLHSGVNAVSGDFSVGVEGLMIRNGELAEPIREATLGSTLPRLFLGVSAVGADLEWRPGGTGAVSLVVEDVTLSGN